MYLLILQFSPISCYFVPLIIHNCYSMITVLQMLLVNCHWVGGKQYQTQLQFLPV